MESRAMGDQEIFTTVEGVTFVIGFNVTKWYRRGAILKECANV